MTDVLAEMRVVFVIVQIRDDIPVVLKIKYPDVVVCEETVKYLIHRTDLSGKTTSEYAVIPVQNAVRR